MSSLIIKKKPQGIMMSPEFNGGSWNEENNIRTA